MPTIWIAILGAVVAGWFVQLFLTLKQAEAFNKQVVALRRHGTATVGVSGKRYRGGRAYVALAVDDNRIVRDAISLSGWTTFARGKAIPALVGVKASVLKGDQEIPGVTKQQRGAAREALVLLDRERRRPAVQAPSA
jgi:DNA-binding transcriptional regulator of glucitol operon